MPNEEERNIVLEYRYYDLPQDFPIIGLLENNFVFKEDLTPDITLMHFHNCIEISYCHAGDKIVFVEEKSLDFSSGDVSVILPFAMHIAKNRHVQPDRSFDKCEYIYFDPELMLHRFYPNGLPQEMKWYNFPDFNRVIKNKDNPQIAKCVTYILDELRYRKDGYEDAVRGMILSLMIELSRVMPIPAEQEDSPHDTIMAISPALEYINCNYSQEMDMNHLADLCHMSLTHFRRCFKQRIQCSPSKYINSIRLRKACDLLDSTEDTILDIVMAVGFESVSSFNRHFMETLGETPSQWRSNRFVVKKKNLKHSTFNFN